MAKPFRGPQGMNPMAMMNQIQKLQEQIQVVQAQLADETVTETAGGGAVSITVTGDQRCREIVIDPQVLQDADVEMLQDLLLTAVNSALDASRKMAAARMGPLTGGLPF
jgi:DNA-binding YbaB/EbfC family protein